MTKVAINGFGRIGRSVFRRVLEFHPDLEVVAINDLTDNKTLAHLLRHDSIYGVYSKKVDYDEESITVDGTKYPVSAEKDPENLPWKDLGVDIVLECTGYFTKIENAEKHINAGAKKVILSAPGKSEGIPSFILGVNEGEFDPDKHNVFDMGSCTTNCLAPITKVLNDEFGIKSGVMTTIHSYTNDQKLLDLPHKDLRRARAAAMNIIPTTTGAAKALGKVIPELKGKLDGISLRVPTPIVSVVDLVVQVNKNTTKEEVNEAFRKAAKTNNFKEILRVEEEPLVSTDYIGDSYCSIVDLEFTDVHENLVKVLGWYDNEYGYSSRLAQFTDFIGSKL